jgi:hypothetical protein
MANRADKVTDLLSEAVSMMWDGSPRPPISAEAERRINREGGKDVIAKRLMGLIGCGAVQSAAELKAVASLVVAALPLIDTVPLILTALEAVCRTLEHVHELDRTKNAFATPEMVQTVTQVLRILKTPMSVRMMSPLLTWIVEGDSVDASRRRSMFAIAPIADALLGLAHHTHTDIAAAYPFWECVTVMVGEIGETSAAANSSRNVFGTRAWADAICLYGPGDNVLARMPRFLTLLCAIAEDTGNTANANTRRNAFTTKKMVALILNAANHIRDKEVFYALCRTVQMLTICPSIQQDSIRRIAIVATPQMMVALAQAAARSATPQCVACLASVVVGFCLVSPDASAAASTPAFVAAVLSLTMWATTFDIAASLFSMAQVVVGPEGQPGMSCRRAVLQPLTAAATACVYAFEDQKEYGFTKMNPQYTASSNTGLCWGE